MRSATLLRGLALYAAVLVLASGLGTFTLWNIINPFTAPEEFAAWARNEPLTAFLWIGRYVLVLPIMYAAKVTGLDANVIFGGVCLALLVFLAGVLAKATAAFEKGGDERRFWFFHFVLFWLVSFFMNGRLLFAFSGYSLILLYSLRTFYRRGETGAPGPLLWLSGLLFCSVSTGTLITACLQLGLVAVAARADARFRLWVWIVVATAGLAALSKNAAFFVRERGYLDPLLLAADLSSHGYGHLLSGSGGRPAAAVATSAGIAYLFLVAATVVVTRRALGRAEASAGILSAALLPLALGIFGLGLATLCLPPLAVLGAHAAFSRTDVT